MTIAMTMGTTIVMTTLMTINYDNLYDKFKIMPAIMMTNSRYAADCWIIIVTVLAALMSMRVSKSQESNIDPNSHAQPAPEF